jgi:hypothetical protein
VFDGWKAVGLLDYASSSLDLPLAEATMQGTRIMAAKIAARIMSCMEGTFFEGNFTASLTTTESRNSAV